MRVLIACEMSGRIRREMRRRGHKCWSVDLLPAEDGETVFHWQTDVREVLQMEWDLVIAHPPCDHLANSGARWAKSDEQVSEAVKLFNACLNANAPRVAVENPVMNRKRTGIRKPDFSVQPWHFVDWERKRTCFWTRGLPPLLPWITEVPPGITLGDSVHKAPPGPNRKADRARTFPGIARAIAEQWA